MQRRTVIHRSLGGADVAALPAAVEVRYDWPARVVSTGLAGGYTYAGLAAAVAIVHQNRAAILLPVPGLALAFVARASWRWHTIVDAAGWHLGGDVVPWHEVDRAVLFRGEQRRSFLADTSAERHVLDLPRNRGGSLQSDSASEDALVREAHWLAHRLGVKPVKVVVDLGKNVPASGHRSVPRTTFWTGCSECDPLNRV